MFQEQIASLTANHLRSHIKALLEEVNALHDDRVTLRPPQSIDPASMAGGVMAVHLDKLPAYAVDCIGKAAAPTADNLNEFQYDGHIAGTVLASTKDEVDKLVKRHEAGVELFVRRHMHFHSETADRTDFLVTELSFLNSNFSGAILERPNDERDIWLAGFLINVVWVVSEDGPSDHR